ncbi:hypothetical protein KPATCC21470_0001 [Kitasatospora purpeofusca]
MAPQQGITEVTRRRVFDTITLEEIAWAGRLDEDDFLRRIYDLEAMVSYDSRSPTPGATSSSTGSTTTTGTTTGPDGRPLRAPERLRQYLPALPRRDAAPGGPPRQSAGRQAAPHFQRPARADGYELVQDGAISGLPFKGVRNGSFHGDQPQLQLESRRLLTDPRVLHEHLVRIRDGLQKDPRPPSPPARSSSRACARSYSAAAGSSTPTPTNSRSSTAKSPSSSLSRPSPYPTAPRAASPPRRSCAPSSPPCRRWESSATSWAGPRPCRAQSRLHPARQARPQQCRGGHRVPPRHLGGTSRPRTSHPGRPLARQQLTGPAPGRCSACPLGDGLNGPGRLLRWACHAGTEGHGDPPEMTRAQRRSFARAARAASARSPSARSRVCALLMP